VPSLKQYVRDVAAEVPSPKGGSVLAAWLEQERGPHKPPPAKAAVGNLGSGSDYTPFLQHAGVPSTDIGSGGAYGVYHSVFDNYAWFTKFADPHFVYEQQQARVLGLEVLHMADADVLPYDYVAYAQEISSYLSEAKSRAAEAALSLDLTAAEAAAAAMLKEAQSVADRQKAPSGDLAELNAKLRAVESDLLNEQGLPDRPWYRHVVYAPGEYTGYAAVTVPGISEAITAKDAGVARQQAEALTAALRRAAADLKSAAGD
jgi:N-acetylated-alpha-linked acidic dipeptidase